MQVYLIKNGHGDYKIGFTSKRVIERIAGLQTGASSDLTVVTSYYTKKQTVKMARTIEGILHRQHQSKKLKGEWFALTLEDEMQFVEHCSKIERNVLFLEENKIGI